MFGLISFSGPALYLGPGNTKAGWGAWGGFRAFSNESRGTSCVDIYNTVSTVTQTFVTLPNGNLDTASIATFLGTSPGKVAKVWDQTGNGFHWTQATPANMPSYVASVPSLGGKPGMFFTNSLSTVLASANNSLSTSTGTMSVVAGRMGDDHLITSSVFTSGTSSTGIVFPGPFDTAQGYAGTSAPQPCLDLSSHAIDCVFNGASSFSCIDGTIQTYNAGGNTFNGSNFKVGLNLTGIVAEFGFHPSIFSQADAQAQNTDKNAYWFNSALYEGIVATRTRRLQTSAGSGNSYIQSRSGHIATENLTAIAIAFETQTNGGTITQAIEYPAGTFTQVTWVGAATFSYSNSSYVAISDYITVPGGIATGQMFWVRTYFNGGGGGAFYNNWQNSFYGEATTLSATPLTDLTMGGTITNSGSFSMPPCAIIGLTSNPSWFLSGDSQTSAVGDAEDTSSTVTGFNGKIGLIARSFGSVPFSSAGTSGSISFPSGCKRLMGKCSHFVNQVGINNLRSGTTAATLTADIATMFSLLKPKQRRYQTTITANGSDPGTPSAAWTTLGQQTTDASNSQRVLFNDALRAGTSGLTITAAIDVATPVESSLDSGKWLVTPAPPYTGDGLHPNVAGYTLVQNANLVPTPVWP